MFLRSSSCRCHDATRNLPSQLRLGHELSRTTPRTAAFCGRGSHPERSCHEREREAFWVLSLSVGREGNNRWEFGNFQLVYQMTVIVIVTMVIIIIIKIKQSTKISSLPSSCSWSEIETSLGSRTRRTNYSKAQNGLKFCAFDEHPTLGFDFKFHHTFTRPYQFRVPWMFQSCLFIISKI